jgi:glycine/D-amino acid oxidase-like deaminating enzyme
VTQESLNAATPHPVWWDGLQSPSGTGAPLNGDRDVDVVIVGAGYTGLWTAYELTRRDPQLSIVVLEREHIGFGASGRNGGWCYDGFASDMERVEQWAGLDVARDFGAARREMVGEVAEVVADEGIDCGFHRGGSIEFLRNGGQLARAHEEVETLRRYGWTEQDLRVMSSEESREIARASNVRGGLWSSNTAALNPARLALGLAAAAERRGVTIHERTGVATIEPGAVTTATGARVRARVVIRATEGYTAEIPGLHRSLAPLYSLMIATEPLTNEQWDEIGLADRQTFGDFRHLVVYGQRTADGRIAFGGRGAPYDFGSRVRANADFPADVFTGVRDALVDIFPQLDDVAITHRWGGVLGVSRQWLPIVEFDPATGMAAAGGYVGAGVAATNLAGRTLAELVTGSSGRLTKFPWVNHHVRRWEPEPLRWIGINTALRVMGSADAAERRHDRPAKRADLMWRIVKL